MEILWGIFGALLTIGLVVGGFVAGWKMNDLCREKSAAAVQEELTEQDKKRLREDNEAFQQLLNYNSDVAYGIKPSSDER